MLIAGVLLVLVAVVAGLLVLLGDGEQATVTAGGLTWSTSVEGVFLLGAATLVVLAVGIVLIRAGSRRRLAQRREFRRLRREQDARRKAGSDSGATPPLPPDFGAPGPR